MFRAFNTTECNWSELTSDSAAAKHASNKNAVKVALESFIDSCVWGHVDELLKAIDNKYCLNAGGETYSYEKRNRSTSHVHMMFATAITEMIDAAECVFFLNTTNSITSSEAVSKTKSPWLFFELGTIRSIRRTVPERLRSRIVEENFSHNIKKAGALNVEYVVPLSELTSLSSTELNAWQDACKKGRLLGKEALDVQYKRHLEK